MREPRGSSILPFGFVGISAGLLADLASFGLYVT